MTSSIESSWRPGTQLSEHDISIFDTFLCQVNRKRIKISWNIFLFWMNICSSKSLNLAIHIQHHSVIVPYHNSCRFPSSSTWIDQLYQLHSWKLAPFKMTVKHELTTINQFVFNIKTYWNICTNNWKYIHVVHYPENVMSQ